MQKTAKRFGGALLLSMFLMTCTMSVLASPAAASSGPTMEDDGYYFRMNGETVQIYYDWNGAGYIAGHLNTVTAQTFDYAAAQGRPLDDSRTFDNVEFEISAHVAGWIGTGGKSHSANPMDINHDTTRCFDYIIDRS